MKRFSVFLLAALAAVSVYAQTNGIAEPEKFDLVDDFGLGELDLFVGGFGSYDDGLALSAGGGLSYAGENLALIAEVYMRKDGIYSGTSAQTASGGMGGFYFRMEAGGVAYRKGSFLLRAGRLPHYDVIDSPYSLFVNGDGLTSNLLELSYDDGRFSYSSRWICLNYNSDVKTNPYDGNLPDDVAADPDEPVGFPDRGANLTTYAVRFGDMTFGIQDAIVYVGRAFDFEYFISPIPAYVIQDARRQGGTPWSQEGEENNIIGLYWLWDRPDGLDLHAQWLLDDGNLYWLSPDLFPKHQPFKMAWTAGASKETPYGTFSLYHAGATKYSFEPTYGTDGREYGYTYYPDTVFTLKSGDEVAIPFETLMLGYRNGENNLAFLGKWVHDLYGFDVGASLEFTVSGSKSPANAWHDDSRSPNDGTHLLDEWPLEWKSVLTVGGSRKFGNLFLYSNLSVGCVFNELKLSAVAGTTMEPDHEDAEHYSISIYRPSDTNRFLFAVTVGGRYTLRIK